MARVTYGSGVTELAGSIGGVTYQKNASGNVARLRPKPTVNPTSRQSEYQGNMATLVSHWPTLSQANKDLWDAFAVAHTHTTPWGESKSLSGYQWFLSTNLHRLSYIYGIQDAPPSWTAYPVPQSFTLTATSTYLRANWSPDYDPTNHLKIFLSLPLRQSSLKLRRSLFYVHVRDPGPPMTNFVLTSYFEALANVTWAAFFASADCSVICRMQHGSMSRGTLSSFTSAIIKI